MLAGWRVDMALDVQIEKQLPDFQLNVAFSASETPLSILGPSGAGKTMLLRCIAGLEQPGRGRVSLHDRVLFDSDQRIQVPARRRRIGMLFQHYALFPHRTVAENITFGLQDLSREEKAARLSTLIARTHLEGLAGRYPRVLSGGEQQRTALARALAIDPEALLLDEPLSSLDTHLRSQVEAQLQETFAAYRRPTLLVTHNIEEAYRLGEQLLVLSRGKVAAFGPKEEVFRHPPTREVAQLTGCKNFSRATKNADGSIEALDWNCRLRVEQSISKPPAFLGIRAHHIDFLEATPAGAPSENVLPCWLVRASETPFRITLYLSLSQPKADISSYDLQAEVFKEKWQRFRSFPYPWHVRLSPDALFLTPE
ncbi:MAG TPA: sulfate/molybdate ABC transporter ATP-binding protein [Candidatus Sulfotelmatobacter sp.]|nr:sulfate/molybdate ABC transporter ATP-binding protein [Candidatus Sulfotelmatobacter sp.]